MRIQHSPVVDRTHTFTASNPHSVDELLVRFEAYLARKEHTLDTLDEGQVERRLIIWATVNRLPEQTRFALREAAMIKRARR